MMPDEPPEESRQYYPSVFSQGQQPAQDPLTPSADSPPPAPEPADEFFHGERKKKTFDPRPSALPDTLPPSKAALIISDIGEAHGKRVFRFELLSCCVQAKPYDDASFGRSKLDPATNIAPGGPPAAKFLREMRTWSGKGKKKDLRDWLDACREEHPDDLELFIWDQSGAQVPWELLRLPASGPDEAGGYLGALATITRWPGETLPGPERVNALADPVPSRGDGPVLGHVASSMAGDREVLHEFFEVLPPPGSMFKLFDNLKKNSRPLAMVYVAAHGEFGNAPDDFKLDGFSVELASLFEGELPGLTAQSTLAFLNACYSGSEGIDTDKYDDGALRGFADYFLSHGATGVLAATGAVGTHDARELARQVFWMLEGNPGLTVPQVLRRLRADQMTRLEETELVLGERKASREAERMRVAPADLEAFDRAAEAEDRLDTMALLPLLYPYLYVYFGLPRLWPAAVHPGGRAATGELTGTGG